jgi:hypothetical protein
MTFIRNFMETNQCVRYGEQTRDCEVKLVVEFFRHKINWKQLGLSIVGIIITGNGTRWQYFSVSSQLS